MLYLILTNLWFSIQVGCHKVRGEKPHSSVVLSFPPVRVTVHKSQTWLEVLILNRGGMQRTMDSELGIIEK